jgi:hypothetical protein
MTTMSNAKEERTDIDQDEMMTATEAIVQGARERELQTQSERTSEAATNQEEIDHARPRKTVAQSISQDEAILPPKTNGRGDGASGMSETTARDRDLESRIGTDSVFC